MVVKRPCLGLPGEPCTRLTDRGDHRCEEHARKWYQPRNAKHDANRPTARQRGYDSRHDATRRRLLPLAYGQPCPRCGEPMLRGQKLDLGHPTARSVDSRARADRIEHARCNRTYGAA
jgi:hypothetical protein